MSFGPFGQCPICSLGKINVAKIRGSSVSPLTHWGKNLIKKTLTVVGLALVGMLVGVPAALAADYSQLCLAAGSTDVAVASGPLASTGVGLPIGLWVVAGLVIIAAGLGMVAVSARRRDRPSPSITA